MGEGRRDEEVASSKKTELVQKSTPYLRPKWRQNGDHHPIYDQNG